VKNDSTLRGRGGERGAPSGGGTFTQAAAASQGKSVPRRDFAATTGCISRRTTRWIHQAPRGAARGARMCPCPRHARVPGPAPVPARHLPEVEDGVIKHVDDAIPLQAIHGSSPSFPRQPRPDASLPCSGGYEGRTAERSVRAGDRKVYQDRCTPDMWSHPGSAGALGAPPGAGAGGGGGGKCRNFFVSVPGARGEEGSGEGPRGCDT